MNDETDDQVAFELGKRGVVRITMQSTIEEEEHFTLQATVNLKDLTNLVRDFNEQSRAHG